MFADTLGRDSNTEDGHLVYRGLVDEMHAHKNSDIVNILESGMGAFDEPLLWIITTAGSNNASFCKDFEDTCKDVLKGEKENEGLFIMIFDLDEGDDWEDHTVWAKANPGYGISPTKGFMFQEYQNAKMEGASKRISFLTKNLNIWTASGSTWIPPEVWSMSGKQFGLLPEELKGKTAFGGMDLAYSEDLTAFVLMFPLDDHFAILPYFWIPKDKAIERTKKDGVKYLKWIEQGFIRTTEGDVTDYDVIRQDILEICQNYDVKAINYDPWNAMHIVNQLREAEAPMHPFAQTAKNYHGPMFEFELRVKDKKIIHFDNPVLAWQMQNVELFFDSSGNMKVNKKTSKEKIDGVVSMAMCFGAWISMKKEKKSVYSERGIRTL
jgi:phage terminase large subunit-like protein